jgi:hypothetical protein
MPALVILQPLANNSLSNAPTIARDIHTKSVGLNASGAADIYNFLGKLNLKLGSSIGRNLNDVLLL